MVKKLHYREYIADSGMLGRYDAYQDRYRDNIRESDKVLVELVRQAAGGRSARLLDIGCSTGNLLRHLKRLVPGLQMTGSDLSESAIAKCKADPELAGIAFGTHDMLNLAPAGRFDVIVANAVGYLFEWADYERSARSVCQALDPGGAYIAFEWLHPFAVQDLTITETSQWHPDGLRMHSRPMPKVEATFRAAGFSSVEFRPFTLPIDLPFPGHDADVVTYTRKDEHGERMAFRGVLYQPWCHMIARK